MSTPLYQEALIEAKKLRDAATVEAKNAVLEAVSPLIKQMIDKEISGIILEQDDSSLETTPVAADLPPPAPPAPSPDAGATGPVEATPAASAEVKPPMPGMTPAVSAAAPPIKAPGTDVLGKIDLGPTGEQQIVIPVDALFQKETTPASAETTVAPVTSPMPSPETSAPVSDLTAPPAPAPTDVPTEEQAATAPESISEIYHAVQKFLREQAAPATPPTDPNAAPAPAAPVAAPVPPAPAPPATPDAAVAPPTDLNAAAGATPPAAPPVAPSPPAAPAAAPAAPPAAPVDPNAAPPVAPTPVAAGVPAAVTEYKIFKEHLDQTDQLVQSLHGKKDIENILFLKEAYEKQLFSLYDNLLGLKAKNAISPRLFSFNEDRLGLLHENLNVITSYKRNPLVKGNNIMANKNSLKDLVKALFEGAEGFEDAVGKVDPAGDSKGGSAEHAHKVSGNPKGVKAEAEAAPFSTKQKKEWPGKPSPESLLEQLEEEISELMAGMGSEEEGMHEQATEEEAADEVVLELADEEVVMEARKARARLRKLREQSEENLSLTIDLDGVSGTDVENVNVSLDGEELEVDMNDMDDMDDMGEEEMGEDDSEVPPPPSEEEEEGSKGEEAALMESRKIVRKAVNENKTLRGQLQETQLLTARSLYVNKLFVRDELTGAQKRKIVEYLDSARTIAEAKEIYGRLVRVLDAGKKNGAMIKESATRPAQVLTESAVEPSFNTSRWQILAGVKRNAK
jgi:hypothetical protein